MNPELVPLLIVLIFAAVVYASSRLPGPPGPGPRPRV